MRTQHRSVVPRGAFTIVELLIVIAIILVLAGLILATSGYVQAKAKRSRVEGEIAELSDKLAMRKIIERAKGIVQAEFGVSEEEAYSIIKKQARSRRKTMKEIGEAILLAEELKREQKTNASPAA